MRLEKLKYDEIRKQINDGDVLLYKGKGLFRSGFIAAPVQIVTRSDYSHARIAAWWNDQLMVIEAVGNGVIVNPLSLSLKRCHATLEWYSCKGGICPRIASRNFLFPYFKKKCILQLQMNNADMPQPPMNNLFWN